MVLERRINLLPPRLAAVAHAHNKNTIPRKSHFFISLINKPPYVN